MNFKPLTDRVLIKRTENKTQTASGIFIPDSAQESPETGKVVATGPGKTLENGATRALEVKEGQTVYFRKYAGTELKLDGVEHMLMREDEILAVEV